MITALRDRPRQYNLAVTLVAVAVLALSQPASVAATERRPSAQN
jgi:hypothetical protein